MGQAFLTENELTIKFNEGLPAEAMQRMLTRGENIGITFVMQKKKENN